MTIAAPTKPENDPERECEAALAETFGAYVKTLELLRGDRKAAATEALQRATNIDDEDIMSEALLQAIAWGTHAGWIVIECSRALRRLAARNYLQVTGAQPADENLKAVWRTLQ